MQLFFTLSGKTLRETGSMQSKLLALISLDLLALRVFSFIWVTFCSNEMPVNSPALNCVTVLLLMWPNEGNLGQYFEILINKVFSPGTHDFPASFSVPSSDNGVHCLISFSILSIHCVFYYLSLVGESVFTTLCIHCLFLHFPVFSLYPVLKSLLKSQLCKGVSRKHIYYLYKFLL